MKQEQHLTDYMDHTELALHEANVDLALKDVERMGGKLQVMFEIDRPPHPVTKEDREPIRGMRVTFDKLPNGVLRVGAKEVADRYLIAQMRLIAYERWLASNGPVKRTSSQFVRSTRPPGPDDPVDPDLLERLNSPDQMVAGMAWGELAHG